MSSLWDGEDTIAGIVWLLTSIGSINWGLVEFADYNLVDELGAAIGEPGIATIVYGLVAAAGVFTLLDHLGLYDVPDLIEDLVGNARGQATQADFAKIGLVLVILVAGLGIGLAGVTSAQTEGPTELANGTVDATNATDSVYVDVIGNGSMGGAGPVDVTVTVAGLNSSESFADGTQLATTTLSVAEGATESYSYTVTESDATTYDSIAVVVETSGDETLIDSTDWGSLVENSGGAGGFLDGGLGEIAGIPVVLLVVLLVGGYVLIGDD